MSLTWTFLKLTRLSLCWAVATAWRAAKRGFGAVMRRVPAGSGCVDDRAYRAAGPVERWRPVRRVDVRRNTTAAGRRPPVGFDCQPAHVSPTQRMVPNDAFAGV